MSTNNKNQLETTEKFYGLKYDIAFKKMFVENNDLLKKFISDMLDIPFEEIGKVTVENPDLLPDKVDGKYSRMDIKAQINKQIINIEIQVASQKGYAKRAMYYWSAIYHEQLKAGSSYDSLKKTISMNVLGYNQFPERQDYHSKYVLFDKKHDHELTEILELHFFEILKGVKEKEADKKHLWLKLINAESYEELDSLLENNQEEFVKKGVEVVNNMNADSNFRMIVRMREEAMHERDSLMQEAEERGADKKIAQLIAHWKSKGMSDEEIEALLN
ncbi:MAG: Rpn family recombination-promoting nuclease/putative transposase [Oscillospiraceae bacterium]|nr:Rpn family recombination-promoting nuclease/putative transposase [Oscillospiraceae bacterium]